MAGSITLFDNASGVGAAANTYLQDTFKDYSLPATNNTGYVSNASTNPLGDFFNDNDTPIFATKKLFIKDLVLISDRTKWIQNKATYRIVWHENCPAVTGYVFGDVSLSEDSSNLSESSVQIGQYVVSLSQIGDGIGVTGLFQRAAFIMQPYQNGTFGAAATATAQVAVNAVNGSTIDFSQTLNTSKLLETPFIHATADEPNGPIDIRITSLNAATMSAIGVVVYYSNQTTVFCQPGSTYVNRSKVTTSVQTNLAIPSMGSSLGGKALIYKQASGTYVASAQGVSNPISIAIGSSGTNLVTASTGTGASFPVGTGVVIPAGASTYVGAVTVQSTDTLTVSPTLPFGVSNTLFALWSQSASLAIGSTTYRLARTADMNVGSSLWVGTGPNFTFHDPLDSYVLWGIGTTLQPTDGVLALNGNAVATSKLHVGGYFSALDIEWVGTGICHATYTCNGQPGFGINTGQTGSVRQVLLANGTPGWKNVVMSFGTSHGVSLGIARINFYENAYPTGISTGFLSELETLQSYVVTGAVNATISCPGTFRRTHAARMQLLGGWASVGSTAFYAGQGFVGTSTNASAHFEFFGKAFAPIGSGASCYFKIDGVSTGVNFNALTTLGTEGWHKVDLFIANAGVTTRFEGMDVVRSYNEIKNIQTYQAFGSQIQTQDITPLAVGTTQIARGAVTQDKIGPRPVAISANASYSNATSTFTTIAATPQMALSGRPVLIQLQSNTSGNSADLITTVSTTALYMQLLIDNSIICVWQFAPGVANATTPANLTYIHTNPPTGLHTFTLQGSSTDNANNVLINNIVLVAVEL